MSKIDNVVSKEIEKIPVDGENALFYLRTNGRDICFQSTGEEGVMVDAIYSLCQKNPDIYRVLKSVVGIIEEQKANMN